MQTGYGGGAYSSEVTARQGTPWDISGYFNPTDVVYEVTFIGELHDMPFYMVRGNYRADDQHRCAGFGPAQGL